MQHQQGPWPGTILGLSSVQLESQAPTPVEHSSQVEGPWLPTALAYTAQPHHLRAGLSTHSQSSRKGRDSEESADALRAPAKGRKKDC